MILDTEIKLKTIHIPKEKQMKIKQEVREKYANLCPSSTRKCEYTYELDYKIRRGVELGKVVKIEGNKLHYQYYFNCFVVEKNKIIDMYKNMDQYIAVDEEIKKKHYDDEFKVMV